LPVVDFPHEQGNSDAVTGGYVSRRAGAALNGRYVFGEFGTGRIWVIAHNFPKGGTLPAPVDSIDNDALVSFGEGNDGRLYLVNIQGSIHVLIDS
jgi:hypothetical protein